VLFSQVLRAAQMAAAACTSAEDNLRDNERVGYYVDEKGRLRYDPLKVVNGVFFETSALFGGGGSNRPGLVRNSTQRKHDVSLAKARKEVQAVAGAIDFFNEPIMPDPTVAIPRTRKKSANAEGVIVSSVDYLRVLREEREAKDAAVELVGQNKDKKVREFVDKWLADVRSAEKELVEIKEKGAQLDTAAAVSVALSVKLIKALIVSRSGKTAKAPNNKDHALAMELMAMMTNPRVLLTPPTSASPTSPRAMDDDEEDAGQFDPEGGDFAFGLI
jgi:hypothetical protein